MLNFVTSSITSVIAGTSLGKAYAVKPKLKEYIEVSRNELADAKKKLTALESIKKVSQLNKAVHDLTKAADEVVDDIASEKSLDVLADIVGNHVKDFDSVEDLKEKLPKMKSVKKMQEFALKLIDADNYIKLADLLTNLEKFSELKQPEQKTILKNLEDKTLTEAIAAENKNLDIDKIHADVKKMAKPVCNELKLTHEESSKLIDLFDKLANTHLKKLNDIRQRLVNHLPDFFTAEIARLHKTHPELAALKTEKPAITTKFTAKKAAEKTSEKSATIEKSSTKRKEADTPVEEREGKKFTATKKKTGNQ